jgi:flagellar biosynthesis/type III secretory pathway chaperone
MTVPNSGGASRAGLSRSVSTTDLETHMLSLSRHLVTLLDEEFEALKTQQVDAFEALQPAKETVLHELQALSQHPQDDDTGAGGAWPGDVQDVLRRCRDAHRRNECLIRQHLTVIRGTLQALTTGGAGSEDTYDRSGRLPASGLSFSDDSA